MPSNKDRIYVALYARGGRPTMPGKEDTYHWAVMIGPKMETEDSNGVRYNAKEILDPGGNPTWEYEELDCNMGATHMLLIRIMVGKVANGRRTIEVLRNTPMRQGEPGWNCVGWVKEALERLKADGKALGTSNLEWSTVRNKAMEYCQHKKDQHRFDGQGDFDIRKPPTFDLLEDREVII
ncbi:uncharacterized protein N7515_009376 [Penicillium bovifimosum]|uniref:Uncharacterized protein n=1 Tax=Penicillium bovifimosum TaxID=126998 RepID=A0A9W9KVY4_9EURO|nr:uncharacterized protein N7515_009376 [Penicillium bovifimosum]KAJ5121415.1 hypothetical protein N7515_009376 [Penicillium bovifimosum]